MASAATASISSPAARYRGWLLAFAISLVTSILIVAPFFWLGSASGHDFEFHVASWLDVAGQWREGLVFPRWTEWANYGFGEPRFIFYPPLSWMLGAALSFVVAWSYVPVAFIVLVQTFAGMCAFALTRRILPAGAALFGTACYAANPDALLMIYMRSDYAELLAAALFPLLFLGALRLGGVLEDRLRSTAGAIVLFSASFAAIWLSNAPAGVMASYSAAALFAWMVISRRSWRPLAHGAAGLALGVGLAGIYLLPAVYEQRWVNIAQALSAGLLPSQNFIFTQTSDPEHTLFNWIASGMAIVMMAMTGLAALAARRALREESGRVVPEKLWRALLFVAAVAAALMFRGTSIVWQILPKLRFVQFPWRWMSILAVPFAYFLAAAVARGRWRLLWVGAAIAVLAGTATFLVSNTWWDPDDVPTMQEAVTSGEGFEGADEYDPIGDDHYNLPRDTPRAAILTATAEAGAGKPKASVYVDRWTAEDKEIRVRSQAPALLAIRLLNYPAWRIEVNGATVAPERAEDFDQMIIPVAAGDSRVSVRFTRTMDRTLGGALSGLSLAIALGLLAWGRGNGKPMAK